MLTTPSSTEVYPDIFEIYKFVGSEVSYESHQDLKDDIQRAEVCASRATLEKSTMMLLTTCKVSPFLYDKCSGNQVMNELSFFLISWFSNQLLHNFVMAKHVDKNLISNEFLFFMVQVFIMLVLKHSLDVLLIKIAIPILASTLYGVQAC